MSILSGTNTIHDEFLLGVKYAKKDKNVSFRLSEPDYISLNNIAKKYGLSVSTFIRVWICSVIDYEEDLMEVEKNENII